MVTLKLAVKNNVGQPVESAEVFIEHQKKGMTDKKGNFEHQGAYARGHSVAIEIRKFSDQYYFAPYYDSFKAGNSENSTITMNPVLYFVPKPNQQDAIELTQTMNKGEESEAPAKLDVPANSEDLSKATVDLNKKAPDHDVTDQKEQEQIKEESVADVAPPPIKEDIVAAPLVKEQKPKVEIPAKTLDTGKTISAKSPIVFTIHAYQRKKPIQGVLVNYGLDRSRQLKEGCTTNKRGRCTIKFQEKPTTPVLFMAQKSGHQTSTRSIRVTHKGNLRFKMPKGHSLDLIALKQRYGYAQGLGELDVFIQGKFKGKTNKFGHYSHFFTGKKGELLEIMLRSNGHLPEEYVTDFVVSGDMTLKRHFVPTIPPTPKVAILETLPAGEVDGHSEKILEEISSSMMTAITASLKNSGSFDKIPHSEVQRLTHDMPRLRQTLQKKGWAGTALHRSIDAVILPSIVVGDKISIELAVINSQGKTIAAGKSRLEGPPNLQTLQAATDRISEKILRRFPFEGAITEKNGKKITINLGYSRGNIIKVGDHLDILGNQTDQFGRNQTFGKIGRGKILKIQENSSTVNITHTAPRSLVSVGDLVVLRQKKKKHKKSYRLTIRSNDPAKTPIENANVYLNESWIGTSQTDGTLNLPKDQKLDGTLKIIKFGYVPTTRPINNPTQSLNIIMAKSKSYLKVESEPPQAEVYIDGQLLGKTPLKKPMQIPSGFVKLKIKAPKGFKDYQNILELDEGTLELTKKRAIILERDLFGPIAKLVEKGLLKEALTEISAIPEGHSDYLFAHHLAGDIHLTMLNQPHKAAESYGLVTQSDAVRSFQEKRFIGSHINEGIALFKTAENLAQDNPKVAQAHYAKSIETMKKVAPYLKYVSSDQFAEAQSNTYYYKALSLHRIWNLTGNSDMAQSVFKHWTAFLESSTTGETTSEESPNVQNAKIYMKQAQISLTNPGNKGRL